MSAWSGAPRPRCAPPPRDPQSPTSAPKPVGLSRGVQVVLAPFPPQRAPLAPGLAPHWEDIGEPERLDTSCPLAALPRPSAPPTSSQNCHHPMSCPLRRALCPSPARGASPAPQTPGREPHRPRGPRLTKRNLRPVTSEVKATVYETIGLGHHCLQKGKSARDRGEFLTGSVLHSSDDAISTQPAFRLWKGERGEAAVGSVVPGGGGRLSTKGS